MAHNFPFPFNTAPGQTPPVPFTQNQQNTPPQPPLTPPGASSQQQMAFAQNAQLPGIDMSALAGISPDQLAAIVRLLQSGALPGVPIPPQFAPPMQDPSTLVTNGQVGNKSQTENRDVNMEDGELEDGGNQGHSKERGFLYPPPTGPRQSSRSPRGGQNQQHRSNGYTSASHAHPATSQQQSTPSSQSQEPADHKLQKEAASREFIVQLYKSGYSFDDIAKEVKNTQALRRLFAQLGLTTTRQGVEGQNSTTVASSKAPSVPKPSIAPSVKSAPPANRSEYLAKLAAARSKKTESKPASAVPTKPAQKPSAPSDSASKAPKKMPVISSEKTGLVRQRLEALKAAQAAKTKAVSSPSPAFAVNPPQQPDQNSSYGGLGAGLADAAAQATHVNEQPIAPSYQQQSPGLFSPSPSGGLPGLFMGPSPSQSLPGPFAPPNTKIPEPLQNARETSPLGGSRKRPVAADFDEPPSTQNSNAFKRPFGQNDANEEDESMIIEFSEDDDDEVEEDETEPGLNPFKDFKYLRDLTSKPEFQSQTGTNSPGTPSNPDYDKKMAEIEAVKRKIAEREAQANGKGSQVGLAADVSNNSSGNATPAAITSIASPDSSKQSAGQATTQILSRQQDTLKIQQRLLELKKNYALAKAQAAALPESQESDVEMSGALPAETPIDPSLMINGASDDQKSASLRESILTGNEQASSAEEGEVDDTETNIQPEISNGVEIPQDDVESSGAGLATTEMETDSEPEDMEIGDSSEGEAMDESSSDDDSDESKDDATDRRPEQALLQSAETQVRNSQDETNSDDSSETSSDDSDDSEDYDPQEVQPASSAPESSAETPNLVINDDIAPELQPPKEQQIETSDQVRQSLDEAILTNTLQTQATPKPQFQPYQSVLRKFKNYQFHPDYLKEVDGGYRSTTYNHRIDPDKQLCMYEAVGGICNDRRCDMQHLDSLALTDTDIIESFKRQRVPVHTEEERQRWEQGLSDLEQQFHTAGIAHDTAAVAAHLAEYRRQFVGDPTKTLNLD